MKKVFIIAVIAVFSLTSTQAQEFSFGVKAGVNVASLGGDTFVGGLDSRVSFHIGGLLVVPVSGDFSFQPELLYSSQGSRWNFAGFGSEDLILDYVNVPLLGKYTFIPGLSAEAGPVIGVLVNAKVDGEDVKDNFSTIDAAFAIGATYRLDMGVFFSLRYNKGIMNINDNDNDNLKNQNNVFQISAGYSF